MRLTLPLLRAGSVFLAVLALTGPVLHHERIIRELGKLFVFVDGSRSMQMTDASMPPERKVASMQAMGMLPRSKAMREAAAADAHLTRAQFIAERALDAGAESEGLKEAVSAVAGDLAAAIAAVEKFSAEAGTPGAAPGLLLAQRFGSEPKFFDRNFRTRTGSLPEPVQTRYLESFRLPKTTEVDFTLWVRALLVVPEDGKYRFWIASDDRAQLWLSRDEDPRHSELAARVDGWTEEFDFDKDGSQRSREFDLKKGERYFIEAILEAGPGDNHLAVAWQRPGGEREAPVPGEYFVPASDPRASGDAEKRRQQLRQGLLAKAGELDKQVSAGKGDPFAHLETLRDINDEGIAMQRRIREYVLSAASAYYAANHDSEEFLAKLAEFDALDRKGRVGRLLLNGDSGVLGKLAEQQDIELVALREGEADSLWWQRRGGSKTSGPLPFEIQLARHGAKSDLGEVVKATVGDAEKGVGVLLFSDGQHNVGSSPVAAAKVLGEQGIPMFTIGTGAVMPPEDMAVIDVVGPQTVFAKDRVKGVIVLRDTVRSGGEFELKIESGGETVWSQSFDADGRERREFEYDFPVEGLVAAHQEESAGGEVEVRSVPLSFEVSVAEKRAAAAEEGGEAAGTPLAHLAENDRKPLFVQAIAHPRKVLLIDARPRWETRYLHNMFERDEGWEVNALMRVFTNNDQGKSWERGTAAGTFPHSREELFKYESVFIGDVPRFLFEDEELKWLAEFVEGRGGGLVFIDGRRGHLRGYAGTELGELLPVEWIAPAGGGTEPPAEELPVSLSLTSPGADFPPLRFAGTGDENAQIWKDLRPPHWVAPVRGLPGTEVLANAEFRGGSQSPALVRRRSGAGRVLYAATDELWRWRYNVADRHHQKFWVQVTNWVGERPFAVVGKRVSIGADKLVYEPGGSASIRVRVRDEDGRPVGEGDYVALLVDAGDQVAAEVELQVDENGGGMFRGQTGELRPGEYEIAVRQKYFLKKDTTFGARAKLLVKGAVDRELDDLSLDAELLQNIARGSGGQFFHEEETQNLVNLLESIDRKKVIPSQTVLWSSYWWFFAILALLTTEWILRKRAGYV